MQKPLEFPEIKHTNKWKNCATIQRDPIKIDEKYVII